MLTSSRLLRCGLISLNSFVRPLLSAARAEGPTSFDAWPHAVLESNAHDINANLSAEEALIRGVLLQKSERLLFLYRNDPCVVVGRNQNIFEEVSLRRAHRDGVTVARRASGGGTVFQDSGNLCFSFFTHRVDYAPERTIQVLRHGLSELCGIDPARLTSTHRHDLFLDGYKITGSAMRVQRDIAFHHCTLLISTLPETLGRYLHGEGNYAAFASNSIGSVRSAVTTLARAGVLPAAGDPVSVVSDFFTKYFLERGPFIAGHEAPWALTAEDIAAGAAALPSAEARAAATLRLDVASSSTGAAGADEMLLGEKRPRSARDSVSFAEELARLRSTAWQFAMPKFTTQVTLTAAELRGRWIEDGVAGEDALPALTAAFGLGADRPAGGEEGEEMVLLLTAVVDQRTVAALSICRVAGAATRQQLPGEGDETGVSPGGPSTKLVSPAGGHAAGDGDAVAWLHRFLATALVGSDCDSAALLPDGPDAAPLQQGLSMEFDATGTALGAVAEMSEEDRSECLFQATRSLVRLWQHKNAFDFAHTHPAA